ncbi:MAG TPA: NUDIX domain-containing protein [Trueperaceae bacterium]
MPLEIRVDRFRGVIVVPESIPCEPDLFAQELDTALEIWTAGGYRLAWLELRLELAELIPLATARGFRFHHTSGDSLMLTRRLSADSFVPPFASHYVGAGGAVFSPEGEILAVVERYGPGHYKLPGGLVEVGEDIADGVRREVREETGVDSDFQGLLAVTHAPRWIFGRASLYLVCALEAVSREIVRQESEIAEAVWMPLAEFMASDRVSPFTRDVLQAAMEGDGLKPRSYESVTSKSTWELFLPESDD